MTAPAINRRLCVVCQQWIDTGVRRQRQTLDHHIRTEHPEAWARQNAVRQELRGEDSE